MSLDKARLGHYASVQFKEGKEQMSVTFYPSTFYPSQGEGPELNVSTDRAGWILKGLFPDFDARDGIIGDLAPDELIVAIGNADFIDDGVPVMRTGNFIEGGVRPGYFRDVLEQLAYIACVAKANGERVVFA